MKVIYVLIGTLAPFLFPSNIFSQTLYLGPDTSYCTNTPILLSSNIADSTYSYFWSTGDTTSSILISNTDMYWLNITHDSIWQTQTDTGLVQVDSIITISDSVFITINSLPIPFFDPISKCFPLPSEIINKSMFDQGSTITYFNGLDSIVTLEDTVLFIIPQNGGSQTVVCKITQPNGCFAQDTLVITSLIKPTVQLQIDSTCENIAPVINNHSTDTVPPYIVMISETTTYQFNGMSSFQLPLQDSGNHSFNCVVTNANGCTDTMNLPLYIYDILPREIFGLEPDYCVGAPADLINGNFPGGNFTGSYINDLSSGLALFNPTTVDSNIVITYTYTDSNTCTLSTNQTVEHVFPLPQLSLEGLEPQYCQYDPSSLISVSPPEGELSGQGLSEISTNGGVFTPNILGSNILLYTYMDDHKCSDTITKSTTVNPLPNVELGPSDTLIGIGDTLILGPEFIEPNVLYSWSTGHNGNNLEVVNPGYYVLFGTNNLTTCHSSDTIRVELINKTSEVKIPSGLNIYPIPFTSELFIEGPVTGEFFKVYDVFGRSVKFSISRTDNVIRLVFENPSHPFLVLQLTRDYSVPIVRNSSY